MIYTCYDMIRDCRAGRAQGWSHFVAHYAPVIRKLGAHYFPDQAIDQARLGRLLLALCRPESELFRSLDPAPERWFVAELRQRVLAELEPSDNAQAPHPTLDLETLARALEPLTLVEKQAAWLETMRYTAEQTGVLLRMDPGTVSKIRDKAAERMRTVLENWSRTLLTANGRQLGKLAANAGTPDCLAAKAFLDMLDGRTTWHGREELERHAGVCWHCIDHFCRLAEVLELLRGHAPLPDSEAEPLRTALGITQPKMRGWRRWLGAG
jgi:hypothetical protein